MNFNKEDFKDRHYLYHDETWDITIERLVEDWEKMYAKIEDLLVEKMNLESEIKNLLKAGAGSAAVNVQDGVKRRIA